MIKRIPISHLAPNMYIHDLNSDWIPHGPKRKHGHVRDYQTIEAIVKLGIDHLYIDTDRGRDCKAGDDLEEVNRELEKQLDKARQLPLLAPPTVSCFDEMDRAKTIHQQAKGLVDKTLHDVKCGSELDVNAVNLLVDGMFDSLCRNRDSLACLGRIRSKDQYLLEHSVNLSVLMSSFGLSVGVDARILKQMAVGALLHDIGKILVPDEVLHKPGRLTEDEFAVMRKHVEYSHQLLLETPGVSQMAMDIAHQHHERFDGSGYPMGLKGCQISIGGRMVAVVDVYDAITADRCYHKGVTPATALKRMLEWSESHFDIGLLHQFIRCIGVYPVGSLVRLKSGRIGIVMQHDEKSQLKPLLKVIYSSRSDQYIPVKLLDLAKPSCQDEIDCAVNPAQYGIDLGHFI